MTQLVDEDEHAEHEDEGQNSLQCTQINEPQTFNSTPRTRFWE
jgi:hypothetical protein